MYTRKRQVPRHRGDQIIGGVAAKGLFGAGKALLGQLTDGQKGVNLGEVVKGGAAGAASAIPGVGNIVSKAINNIGGGAQAAPATPGQAPATPGQAPAAPGQAPGAAPGLLQGGIGQGVMGLAQNALGMEHGGSIPYDPELAGAPYSMRGVKLMKSGGINSYEEGGESDPPKADFLLRGDVDDMNELQRSRSDRGSAFGTASTDVFMNTGNIPSMPEGSMMREMEDMEAPEDMQKIESRGPRLLRKDPERGLVGGMKDIPEASKEDSSFSGIYFSPSTSNIRAYVPDGGEGERTFGARGFEMEDRIPYGFREEGRPVYAKPEVFEMMREEGVGARGAAAEDYLAELYKKNPEMFSKKQDTRNIIQQKVLEEAKTRKPGVPGFYIPTSPLKASF